MNWKMAVPDPRLRATSDSARNKGTTTAMTPPLIPCNKRPHISGT